MPIISGGGGSGLPLTGGTLTGALTVHPTGNVDALTVEGAVGTTHDLLKVIDDAVSNTNVFEIAASGQTTWNRNVDVSGTMLSVATFRSNGVFVVDAHGQVSLHPDSAPDAAALYIFPRSTDFPALMIAYATAAPLDANVDTSSFAFWLDDTPAATKLMVKAKDSGGTVRTAAIALA